MRIVIAGAGHAGLTALDCLGRRPLPDEVELVVVSEAPEAAYSGMLPGWVEGLYGDEEVTIPVEPVVRRAGGRLLVDRVEGLDADRREVMLANAGPLSYDACVLNLGTRPQIPEGADRGIRHDLSVKPFRPLRAGLGGFFGELASGRPRALGIVGGGAGGVELALAFCARARREDHSLVLTVLEGGATILKGFPDRFRRRVQGHLDDLGIDVMAGAAVAAVRDGALVTAAGEKLEVDAVLWATAGGAPDWLHASGLALDRGGFVATRRTLASVSHPEVLAVGDIGTVVDDPRPKAGVWSVRAGPPLARQLRLIAAGEAPQPVTLQRQALVLLSVGERRAVATRNGLVVEGGWVWWWKDRIDRAFVRRFRR